MENNHGDYYRLLWLVVMCTDDEEEEDMIKMIFLNPKKETEGERCGCSFCRKGQRGCRMRKWFFQILYSPEWVLLCPVPSIRPGITKQGAFNVGNWFCPKASEAEDGRRDLNILSIGVEAKCSQKTT